MKMYVLKIKTAEKVDINLYIQEEAMVTGAMIVVKDVKNVLVIMLVCSARMDITFKDLMFLSFYPGYLIFSKTLRSNMQTPV